VLAGLAWRGSNQDSLSVLCAAGIHGAETVAFNRNPRAAFFGMRFGLNASRGCSPKVL